jgi:hypothetical protein
MSKTEAALPSTSPEEVGLDRLRRARLGRRIALGFLTLFVALGAVGAFGIRTNTVRNAAGGYRLTVTYPFTNRAQMPVRLSAVVGHDGGFTEPIQVGLTAEYLNLLDLNDIEPQPSKAVSAGDLVVWTFDPPVGDTLAITVDAIVEANARLGAPARVVVFSGGVPVVNVSFRTWVAP